MRIETSLFPSLYICLSHSYHFPGSDMNEIDRCTVREIVKYVVGYM